ncbi:MAG TPA: alpha-L-rhamnosidase C-terminal domain-containing protein [Pseudonocardiaceae bacterium]|jgi:alpha-L-rhamnosidase|nr:alpha-L-rhamnosidase C-terminal domain-containing protein [Pseudonocardiaceae bacterium]
MWSRRKSRRASSTARLSFVVVLAVTAALSIGPAHALGGNGFPLGPGNPDWQRYVESSAAPLDHPVGLVSTSGAVTDPDGLLAKGNGATTLTDTATGPAPSIVLDYGKDIGGVPEFGISAETGTPTLKAGYAEALEFLTPNGDGGRPFESGDSARSDSYRIGAPGVLSNEFIQGGERYQEITLTSPGSVTLSFARIRSTVYPAGAADYAGYFVSSSDQLNRLWYAGAYTLDENMLPPNSPGGYWSIGNGYLTDTGGDAGLLKAGRDWTDYTMSFQTRINGQQAGFVVRGASAEARYLLILDDSVDKVGPANSLQEVVFTAGVAHTIADLPISAPILPGSWHSVRTVVSGSTVSTSVDGVYVGSFDSTGFPAGVGAIPAGTVGFREDSGIGEATDFRDLTVTAPDGRVLYRDPLADPARLADFQAPGVNTGSLILDGAKRDRDVWEGDLSVSGPTLLYSLGATDYLRDSLRLLGSYQLTSGFIEGRRAPGDPLNTDPLPGEVNQYSASYSMYFVPNLATYYTYTADTAFVRQEWPVVQRELAWNARQVDAQGLFETNASDGNNWHYDDQTGAQTYYNVLYYHALLSGATLAYAVGDGADAATYRARAAAVKTAVNTYLFNPATGVYDISTTQRGYVAQDANTFAVRYGVAAPDKVPGILAAMARDLDTGNGDLDVSSPAPAGYHQVIGPFMGSYELWTRFADGDTDGALDLLSREWGRMTTADPGGVLWEVMNTDGTVHTPGINGTGDGATSLAHGWSTGPTSALSEYVLGITPTSPGYADWQVAPQPGDLAWAQGRAPTPHGPLTVKWSQGAGRFGLDVTAPPGTSGTIAVPVTGPDPVVRMNGAVVWSATGSTGARQANRVGDTVRLAVAGGGDYQVQVTTGG